MTSVIGYQNEYQLSIMCEIFSVSEDISNKRFTWILFIEHNVVAVSNSLERIKIIIITSVIQNMDLKYDIYLFLSYMDVWYYGLTSYNQSIVNSVFTWYKRNRLLSITWVKMSNYEKKKYDIIIDLLI